MSETNSSDTLRILIASDNHLGYAEKDDERRWDSIRTFEEILQIAVDQQVDFILLGGDLFHENKPPRWVEHECVSLLRKYCLGDRPVQFEILSDQKENFGGSPFPFANYLDANLNVSYPIFTIHGNHDDPTGHNFLSAVNILSTAGLINYFGRTDNLQNIEISPLLLKKGATKLALFGLGSVRDERLHRLFHQGNVHLLDPVGEDWYRMLVLHQNRSKHGPTNYIPESYLPDLLDLVMWGHEHQCRIDFEWSGHFNVTQPGSSVATSLCAGEETEKFVGVLSINGRQCRLQKHKLNTVRQFFFREVSFRDMPASGDPKKSLVEKEIEFLSHHVERLIEKAIRKHTGHPNQPKKPLIRLRVFYGAEHETFLPVQLGRKFRDRVANPNDIVLFVKEKKGKNCDDEEDNIDEELLKNVINSREKREPQLSLEEMLEQYFQRSDEKHRLLVLSEKAVSRAISSSVEKGVGGAIGEIIRMQSDNVTRHLQSIGENFDEHLVDSYLQSYREDKGSAKECFEIQKRLDALEVTGDGDENGDGDSDPEMASTPAVRGRGRGRAARGGRAASASGRGSRGGRSSKAAASMSALDINTKPVASASRKRNTRPAAFSTDDDDNADDVSIISDDDDDNFGVSNRKTTSNGVRSRDVTDSSVLNGSSSVNASNSAAGGRRKKMAKWLT